MSSVRKNPEETHIFAILHPAKGKFERLKELIAIHINAVHEKEDYAPRYLMTESIDTDEPALHMFETYTSKDDAERHTKTDNFKEFMDSCQKEGVMGKPPYIAFTKTVGGYDWDREKI